MSKQQQRRQELKVRSPSAENQHGVIQSALDLI